MNISKKNWEEHSDLIREFSVLEESHKQLASEISYILDKEVKSKEIKVAHISYRAKELSSFLEKIDRKTYVNPINEIVDLSGVRLVYLYTSDINRIKDIIESRFEILETVDQQEQYEHDQFGYSALHYVVRLGSNHLGARYDDLKDLKCEIQVRTILQDAWSIVSHHLLYKRESQIPSVLKRKIHSLSGLFETADDQFDNIKKAQEKYLQEIDESLSQHNLNQELNSDSVYEYMKWKFPDIHLEGYAGHLRYLVSEISLKTLTELDNLLEKTKPFFSKISDHMGKNYSAGAILAYTYAMKDEEWVKRDDYYDEELDEMINSGWDEEDLELIDEGRQLIYS